MKKTLMVNLSNIELKGDVIDFSLENFSMLEYKNEEIEAEAEIAITTEEDIQLYDSGVVFFNLNKTWNRTLREDIIDKITNYMKKDGYIYIWDLNKSFGEVVDIELKVLCPDGEFKNVTLKNKNIFSSLNIEEVEKILEKNCVIEETKVWEDMFYVKAQKIN